MRRPAPPNPFAWGAAGLAMWRLAFEANMVIAMRMMGMAGVWNTAPSEVWRMAAEKPAAFAEAYTAMLRAAAGGASGDRMIGAGTRPLQRKASANRRRLAGRGLRKG